MALMTRSDYELIMTKAIENYGEKNQMNKCVEELAELTVAIFHFQDKKIGKKKLLLELADVHNMLFQLENILCVKQSEVNEYCLEKAERLKKRMEVENIGKKRYQDGRPIC